MSVVAFLSQTDVVCLSLETGRHGQKNKFFCVLVCWVFTFTGVENVSSVARRTVAVAEECTARPGDTEYLDIPVPRPHAKQSTSFDDTNIQKISHFTKTTMKRRTEGTKRW